MNMIFGTADTKAFAFGIACHGGQVGMHRCPYLAIKKRATILRAENQMNDN